MTFFIVTFCVVCVIGYIGIAIDLRRHRRDRDEFWMMWR